MRTHTIQPGEGTSERRCHCGADFDGADHCPYCGCEKYERYCNANFASSYPATETWMPGQRRRRYITY